MLSSKQILRNHNIAGGIFLTVLAGSYLASAFVRYEVAALLLALVAYALLTFTTVPFFSLNVRLAKTCALIIILWSGLSAAQAWGDSELSTAVLFLSIPLTLISVTALYILIFEQAPDTGA